MGSFFRSEKKQPIEEEKRPIEEKNAIEERKSIETKPRDIKAESPQNQKMSESQLTAEKQKSEEKKPVEEPTKIRKASGSSQGPDTSTKEKQTESEAKKQLQTEIQDQQLQHLQKQIQIPSPKDELREGETGNQPKPKIEEKQIAEQEPSENTEKIPSRRSSRQLKKDQPASQTLPDAKDQESPKIHHPQLKIEEPNQESDKKLDELHEHSPELKKKSLEQIVENYTQEALKNVVGPINENTQVNLRQSVEAQTRTALRKYHQDYDETVIRASVDSIVKKSIDDFRRKNVHEEEKQDEPNQKISHLSLPEKGSSEELIRGMQFFSILRM